MTLTTTAIVPTPVRSTVRVLPTAPTDAELASYEHREAAVIVGMSMVCIVCLTISQIRFTELSPWLLLVLPFLAFTMIYYLASLVITARSRNFDLAAHRVLVESWRPVAYPSVDILLPICNEGLDVLINAWRHERALADRYPGEVTVHVLDDGDSAEAAEAAAAFGFRYTVRPNRGWLKKAGNLQHGYRLTHHDYVAIFDADFCPRPDFLDQLLPYAEADPGLGIVQSPQFFRTSKRQTWMERGASSVQELFYRMIQVSSDCHGGAICVGSCAVYRRTALDDIGGVALIEHSEDVHTGFDLWRVGWRLRYIPVPLATGLCPPDPDSFLTQQYRWCAGTMSLLGARKFWSTKVPFGIRLCHFSGFCYYVHTAVFVFVTPAIPLALIIAEPRYVLLVNFVWILPSILYSVVVFPLWNRINYGPTALMAKYLYSWAHLFAIIDILRDSRVGWQVTGSAGAKANTRRIWRAMTVWGTVTSVAWIAGATWRASQYGLRDWVFLELTAWSYAAVFAMALWSRRASRVAA
jgi:cellulose synthase (UDP-forming)